MVTATQESWDKQGRAQARIARLRWLINLRWVGLLGVAAIGAATQIVGYTVLLNPGWLVAPGALAYNFSFLLWLRRVERASGDGRWPPDRIERQLAIQARLQALCDILALCLVVYFNSGVECPIVFIPMLAILLSSVVLPPAEIFIQANLGAALFALMALAEYQGWIPHLLFLSPEYRQDLYRDFRFVLARVLMMLAALNLTAYLVSGLVRRLNQAEEQIRGLLGQLRQRVKEAAGRLTGAAVGLQGGMTQAGQVAEQIATTVQQIAQGTGQQAEQLEVLSANLESLAEAGRRMAEGTEETRAASAEAVASAEQGRQAMAEATARMEEIARVFAQTQETLGLLAEHSAEIGEVALAIDRFAERTDLLALNAGIEAARAGEHGRGFAVVAGEVKKLAASSAASAERVAEIVRQVQEEIRGVVESVRAGAARVQDGQEAITTLGETIEDMAGVIVRTDELAGTMERLSRQQMEAHRQIVQAAGEIASTAEETAAGAEETAAAVEEQASSFADLGRAVEELAGLAAQLDHAVADIAEESPDVRQAVEEHVPPGPGG